MAPKILAACAFLSNTCINKHVCFAFAPMRAMRCRQGQGHPGISSLLPFSSSSSSSRLSMSNAAELHTGYEWLARQKLDALNEEECCEDLHVLTSKHEIIWMDIESGLSGKSIDTRARGAALSNDINEMVSNVASDIDENADMLQLPLYPLGAVHLPSPGQTHTLNNIEPRNIKMANDLVDPNNSFHGKFCVTLRASDTGRIAKTATLMRVVNTTAQESFDGSLLAIRVECVAEGLVEVQQILNPNAWSKEQRLKKSDEYLVAKVRPIKEKQMDDDDERQQVIDLAKQVEYDFEIVRKIYSNKDAVSTNELPEWAIDACRSNLPRLHARDFVDEHFWRCADIWQQLTSTIKLARRSELTSDVNEITIDEACKLGGPLKLPVHRSDLPIEIQKRLNKMEEDAAENFIARGIDPIVDFQIVLSMPSALDRLTYLALLVSRERRRVEAKSTLHHVFEAADSVEWSPRNFNSNVTSSFD